MLTSSSFGLSEPLLNSSVCSFSSTIESTEWSLFCEAHSLFFPWFPRAWANWKDCALITFAKFSFIFGCRGAGDLRSFEEDCMSSWIGSINLKSRYLGLFNWDLWDSWTSFEFWVSESSDCLRYICYIWNASVLLASSSPPLFSKSLASWMTPLSILIWLLSIEFLSPITCKAWEPPAESCGMSVILSEETSLESLLALLKGYRWLNLPRLASFELLRE